MPTVLWGAKRDDVQFGSQEDIEQAAEARERTQGLMLLRQFGTEAKAAHERVWKRLAEIAKS